MMQSERKMVQDAHNGPRMVYAQSQDRGQGSPEQHWQRPEPKVSRPLNPAAQNHPGLASAPDADRLFSNENVHFPPQSHTNVAHGFHDPRASYDAGPAYVYETHDGLEEGAECPRLGPAQWGGALVSLALILGLGIWGYKLMVRDVTGVPVIRALEGSARLLPEDPGGQLAMHQGLAVNSVTADGSAAAPADRYVLAPAPAELAEEDQPMAAVPPVVSLYEPSTEAFAVQPAPELPKANPATPQLPQSEPMQVVAVEEDPLELQGVQDLAATTPEDTLTLATPVIGKALPIPKPRPAHLAAAAEPSHTASLDAVAGDIVAALGAQSVPTEMSASDVPVGARLVQFGAFQSEDIARSEWDRLNGRFEDLMEGKTRVIEAAESGGKQFYRLRAYGFADAADANRFCAALMAMNAACVPTVQR